MLQTYIYKGPPDYYIPGQQYDLRVRQTRFLKRIKVRQGFLPSFKRERIIKESMRTYRNWMEFNAEWERPHKEDI